MTLLDDAIVKAHENQDSREAASAAWLTLLRTPLFLPIHPDQPKDEEEPFRPLYAMIDDRCFIATFDTEERLSNWAGIHHDKMRHVTLPGRELIQGLGENVWLALNAGTPFYKEFSPDEIRYLKKIIGKMGISVSPDSETVT